MDSGWHIYSITQPKGGPIATQISLPAGQPFKRAGAVSGPKPATKFDSNFGINIQTHQGTVTFRVPVLVVAATAAGEHSLTINVRYQACNDSICLPARTVHLTAPVKVAEGASAPPQTLAETTEGPESVPADPVIKTSPQVKDSDIEKACSTASGCDHTGQ